MSDQLRVLSLKLSLHGVNCVLNKMYKLSSEHKISYYFMGIRSRKS